MLSSRLHRVIAASSSNGVNRSMFSCAPRLHQLYILPQQQQHSRLTQQQQQQQRQYCTKNNNNDNNNNNNTKKKNKEEDKDDEEIEDDKLAKNFDPTSYDKMFTQYKENTTGLESQLREQLELMRTARERHERNKQSRWRMMLNRHGDLAWVILGLATFGMMFKSFANKKQHKSLMDQVSVHQQGTKQEIDQLDQLFDALEQRTPEQRQQLAQLLGVSGGVAGSVQQQKQLTDILNKQ
ncbi:hypothetical protein SAMD00019534_094440 [Acytostelium subglobosum LB1]|uniref:hypothetical protein n=1 Tax=Acytostelium subglobosum LB1 TaxID=1410327 RepID=UPI000644EA4A|nr:hypothetical protein SAMD00019534_094440 [Acytostelium subglobosum LB1]GAM26269.1 hypothetical protein SAMD00019534_094440 [Acytostelium subglobosum LB1]|eukprot:XP_012750823.1 hypothetical protein SAMD00019534_094440 [Acytostelium subglobosum LB1]